MGQDRGYGLCSLSIRTKIEITEDETQLEFFYISEILKFLSGSNLSG